MMCHRQSLPSPICPGLVSQRKAVVTQKLFCGADRQSVKEAIRSHVWYGNQFRSELLQPGIKDLGAHGHVEKPNIFPKSHYLSTRKRYNRGIVLKHLKP